MLIAVYGFSYWESSSFVQGPTDVLVSWVASAAAIVLFWIYRQATPGKIAVGAQIVDAKTGGKPSTRQLLIRYIGNYVSSISLFLGFIWAAFDLLKQGWHDKMADTVVVRNKDGAPRAVQFGSGST